MFTGIIEELGTVEHIVPQGGSIRLQIRARLILTDLAVDQSVAVNGVCLTAVEVGADYFVVDAVAETLARSTLKQLRPNDKVNLERALRLQDRLGGHLIQGHVDGIGSIRELAHDPGQVTLGVEIPPELERYTISKGSIAIDGVSLTIANKRHNFLSLAIIPHTMNQTTFQYKKAGDRVNIEVDFLAKYIEQFLTTTGETKLTPAWLKQQGF